ncbi:MAG TPA: T9SS type A sorting domain-containing protein, partial [Ignavibacteria bacterium]
NGFNFTVIPTNIFDELSLTFINELTGFSPAWGGGILRTTNGGYNWQYFQILSEYDVSQIGFAGNTSVYILMKKYIGDFLSTTIFKSDNFGQTWILSLSPTDSATINSFQFINQFTGYAVGKKWPLSYSKIYKTSNGGATWDSVASNMAGLKAVFFINSNTGYVVSNRILKTTNSCLSWDTVYNIGSPFNYIKFFNDIEGYAASNQEIAKTSNGGTNWNLIYTFNRTFLVDINNGLGLGRSYAEANFLYKTANSGLNWVQITQGFWYDMTDVYFINENTGFAGTYNNKILKTINGGFNWSEYTDNSLSVENIQFVNDNTGYAGLSNGKIAKTTNCGNNWVIYETGCYDHNHGIAFPSADTGYAVTKYGFYLKTINGGVNWINFGQQFQHFGDVQFINNNTGFAGGWTSRGFMTKTINGGLNWSLVEFDSVSYFNDVCTSNQSSWFAAGSGYYNGTNYPGYIYRSLDAGISWTYMKFPNQITAIHFPTQVTGYASSYNNVMYKTTNEGDSWFPTECINTSASYGIWFTDNYTGYAVGYMGQIIKTTTGGGDPIGIQPINNETPRKFIMHQNYPNPFNPVTTIRFEIPKLNAMVKLTVYDILGREITTLVSERLTPGMYVVEWNALNYPSGVYFYRLIAGDFYETKKMVFLK